MDQKVFRTAFYRAPSNSLEDIAFWALEPFNGPPDLLCWIFASRRGHIPKVVTALSIHLTQVIELAAMSRAIKDVEEEICGLSIPLQL